MKLRMTITSINSMESTSCQLKYDHKNELYNLRKSAQNLQKINFDIGGGPRGPPSHHVGPLPTCQPRVTTIATACIEKSKKETMTAVGATSPPRDLGHKPRALELEPCWALGLWPLASVLWIRVLGFGLWASRLGPRGLARRHLGPWATSLAPWGFDLVGPRTLGREPCSKKMFQETCYKNICQETCFRKKFLRYMFQETYSSGNMFQEASSKKHVSRNMFQDTCYRDNIPRNMF